MKLKNFMYATMIACAFASCSKDDVNGPDGPDSKADATLSVKFNIVSKSTEVTDKTDETITNLRVYVFNGDGSYQTQATNTGGNQVMSIPVKPGAAKVVAVANFADDYQPANVDALYGKMKDWNSEKDGSLTMNSQTYNVSLVGGTTNYLGYTTTEAENGNYLANEGGDPVKMYRNVAKVRLASIKVDAEATQYPDAKLLVEDVFILHGSAATKLVGGAAKWAPTFVPTTDNKWVIGSSYTNEYASWVAKMEEARKAGQAKVQNYVELAEGASFNFLSENDYIGTALPTEIGSGLVEDVDSFYVYENPNVAANDINTLLVVKGKFIYTGVTGEQALSTYYTVAVGKDNVGAISKPLGADNRVETLTGVLRNLQYNIALKVKSPGYETPFGPVIDDKNTALDVKVEVVAWGQVDQFADI